MDEETRYFINWKGQTQGPHNEKKIRSLLGDRKIHSLFKVEVDGEEILVREFLANIEEQRREEQAREEQEREEQRTLDSETVPDEPVSAPPGTLVTGEYVSGISGDPIEGSVEKGRYSFAVTSFVLSLLFAIPLINMVAWIISLSMGHSFLSSAQGDRTQRGYYLAWSGVWLTYIFGGLFALAGMVTLYRFADAPSFLWFEWHGFIAGLMIVLAFLGALNSLFVIAGVKISVGKDAKVGPAFVAGTFGVVAAAAIGLTYGAMANLQYPGEFGSSGQFTLQVIGGVAGFLFQCLGWSYLVRLKDDSELGLARAFLLSLFCTVTQIFLSLILLAIAS
ncbi:hypothetical protein N9017_01485, partial [Akkermansiaceae bacterium]|nr:hypothetical protein [Akkermansiaceae bacterium]